MTTLAGISSFVLVVACVGLSVYLLIRGRMSGRACRGAAPWVIFVARLCLLAAAMSSLLVMNSAKTFAVALGCFVVSVWIEAARRQRASHDEK